MSDIIVKFKPQGHKELINAINKINTATGGYTKTTDKATKGSKQFSDQIGRNRKPMSIFENSLSTIRSRLLVFNFAMAMGVKQLVEFSQQAAKLQSMETAFNTLAGGGANAAIAVDKLKEATNGTLSEFDLFQQANNAMILGVTKNSDEMAQMFDMAQRLGAALGKDTKMSIESLVTGIGRQSRMMLDNIGIVVDSEKAYQDYATANNLLASNLTDAERKQAFMNATLDAAREKLKGLPDEVLNADQKFQSLTAALDNASKKIGEAFLPVAEFLAEKLTAIADAFDERKVKAYATVIGGVLLTAMVIYRKELEKVIMRQTMLGWGALATAAGLFAAEMLVLSGVFDDLEDDIKDTGDTTKDTIEDLEEFNGVIRRIHTPLLGAQASMKGFTQSIESQNNIMSSYLNFMDNSDVLENVKNVVNDASLSYEDYNIALGDAFGLSSKFVQALDEQKTGISLSSLATQGYVENQDELKAVLDVMIEKNQKLSAQDIETIVRNFRLTKGVEDRKNANKDLILTEEQLLALETKKIKSFGRLAGALGALVGSTGKNAKEQARLAQLSAIIDTYAGVNKTFKQGGGLNPATAVAAAAILAQGLANVAIIESNMGKMGGSSGGAGVGGTYGKFEQGGYVGGNRHSQGGTIIEAERGEFVMSRNAVESIGLETLNQMNQSGGGGSINVSVTGNVLTQDFVEGELAESIKEAVRRGSDFGIG